MYRAKADNNTVGEFVTSEKEGAWIKSEVSSYAK
jgi:hypothetical protein